MKITVAQLNPIIGDLKGNTEKILTAAKNAAQTGSRLLLTPELSLCGYPPRDLLLDPCFVENMQKHLEQLAAEIPAEIAILVGTVDLNTKASITGGKTLFNSIALIDNNQIKQIFHKRLLPTYDVFDEHRYFEPGGESNFFTLDNLKIGVTICEDLWNDEQFWGKRTYTANPIADLAEIAVDLIVNLSASPYTVNKHKLRQNMLQHCAKRFQTPIIYTNQIGGNDDLIFDGCSVVYNRAGEMVFRGAAFEEDFAEIHFQEQQKDILKSNIATIPNHENEEIFSALVLGVRDYAIKCGFKKVVLGLSGGIDSSLVAAIGAEAVGAKNVLGILMPSPYSSEHSISDALKLAENLGIQTQILPIGDLMKDYDKALAEIFTGTQFGIAEENIQSRIRGNLLMAISNKFGHLLLSTGNKSEMAVGYCTLYGDMNGGLATIADVPKTRVYQICRWLNDSRQKEIIPENVITKPPSAELKPGQKDQDSLPEYEVLDDILNRLIHNHESPAQIVAAGHDAATVERVAKLVKIAEFKRRQAPPGLKVTDRAFGIGWRMPVASRRGC
jgi:NAD+ synthase (glutamine-hydrolysing)